MLNLESNFRFSQESQLIIEDGDVIFSEGDEGREMYVVTEGEVVVSKKTSQGEITLAVLKKGEFVGEMSLLESLPRSATARAKGRTKLLVIQPGGFLLKIRRDPTFAFEMLQAFSKRIRRTNDALLWELNKDDASLDSLKTILQSSEFQVAGSPRLVK
ncbi:MAG: cyclic nucleotide-binding domain-containing protein [Pseudobdellovibrionaceae bacterium]